MIKLKVKKAEGKHDLGTSKFLGRPTLPKGLAEEFDSSVLFFLQINLEEIKDLDKENLLPHTGYLYFFIDTSDDVYDLKPIVKYFDGIPEEVIDDFNSVVPGYEEYQDEYLVEFELSNEDSSGTKLFGYPSDWNYSDEPNQLLLQFDPLDSEMGIFDMLDGYLYFFFDHDNPLDFDKVILMEEYS